MLSTILLLLDTQEKKTKFESIYNEHHKKMMNIAYSITKDQYDAEDAMHTALLAIAENIDKIKADNKDMLKSYLYKTVKNAAIDILRKKSKTPLITSLDDVQFADNEELEEYVCIKEQYIILATKIKSMPSAYRDVLVLHWLHNLTVEEISVLLHRKRNTIKSQLNRGNKILKDILKEEGIE